MSYSKSMGPSKLSIAMNGFMSGMVIGPVMYVVPNVLMSGSTHGLFSSVRSMARPALGTGLFMGVLFAVGSVIRS